MSESDSIKEYATDGIVVTWEPSRCEHARECVMGLPGVFDPKRRPWIDATAAGVEDLVTVIDRSRVMRSGTARTTAVTGWHRTSVAG